ncbi:MAG TPA: hypothetical protein VJ506_10915 [Candidatus Limnocylindrales bacterium]|nr:hypothetical protein [Candidatus Limnocylindrales bacterium]
MRNAGGRELVVGAGVVLALGRFVDPPVAWIVAALLLLAIVLGALQVFGEATATTRAHGVPIESLLEPAVLAFGGVGAMRLVPVGLLLIPALAVVLWVLNRSLALEARLAAATSPPSGAERTAILGLTMVAGLGAFAGMAALVPGGLPEASGPGAPTNPALVLALAASDGLVAFLLAYRVAALRSSNIRDVGWAASTGAAVVAIAAAALRTLEIPWLLGPALLVLVFFLWEAMHGGAPSRRRDPRRLWEALLLVVVGLLVVAWSVGPRI